jgi:hypothetical protein
MLWSDASLAGIGYAMPRLSQSVLRSATTGMFHFDCLSNCNSLMSRVDNDKRIRVFCHALEAAEHIFELGYLAVNEETLKFGELGELALFAKCCLISEAVEAALNLRKVGDRATYPTAG